MKNNQVKKSCEYCQKEFMARNWKNSPGKFCSPDCQRKGRNFKKTTYVYGKCKNCDKEFSQPKWWKGNVKFCSIQCMSKVRGKNMRGQNHPRWKGGSKRTGLPAICKQIKKEIRKCQKCSNERNLHVHHKIAVSERPDLAKDPANIEVLCAECHAKEHPEFKGMLLRKKSGIYKLCDVCEKEFYIPKYREKLAKYCSSICSLQKTSIKLYRKNKELSVCP